MQNTLFTRLEYGVPTPTAVHGSLKLENRRFSLVVLTAVAVLMCVSDTVASGDHMPNAQVAINWVVGLTQIPF